MSALYINRQNYEMAIEFDNKALLIRQEIYRLHPDLATSYYNIASSLIFTKRFKEALDNFKEALNMWIQLYGQDHPNVGITYLEIGSVLVSLGNYDEALESFHLCLEVFQLNYDENHPLFGTTFYRVAQTLSKQEKHLEAIDYYKKTAKNWINSFDEKHPNTANINGLIAAELISVKKYWDALPYLMKEYQIRKTYPTTDLPMKQCCDRIYSTLILLNRKDEASEFISDNRINLNI